MTGVPRIPVLELVKANLRRFSRDWQLAIEISDGDAAKKLFLLEARRRHFLSMGGEMPAQIARYIKAQAPGAIASSDPNAVQKVLDAAAAGARALVLLRFRNGGGDARPMWGLKASTIAKKRAKGAPHPERIGWDTGELYAALEASRFFFLPK